MHEGSERSKDVCLQCERLVDLQEREESGEVLHHQQVVPLLSTEFRLGGGPMQMYMRGKGRHTHGITF